MSAAKPTTSGAVHLRLPSPPPDPAPGCDVCEALAKQRHEAEDRGDVSAASEADAEIRNHPREARRR